MVPRAVPTLRERIDLNSVDIKSHAKSLSVFTSEIQDLKVVVSQMAIDKAVRVEVDKNLNDRLARIEKSIDQLTQAVDKRFAPINGVGKFILTTVGALLIAALVKFIISGNLMVLGT